jgi:hypothetical protein
MLSTHPPCRWNVEILSDAGADQSEKGKESELHGERVGKKRIQNSDDDPPPYVAFGNGLRCLRDLNFTAGPLVLGRVDHGIMASEPLLRHSLPCGAPVAGRGLKSKNLCCFGEYQTAPHSRYAMSYFVGCIALKIVGELNLKVEGRGSGEPALNVHSVTARIT